MTTADVPALLAGDAGSRSWTTGRVLAYETPTALIHGLDAPNRITLTDCRVITTREPAAEIARLSQADLDGVRVQTGTLEDVFLDLVLIGVERLVLDRTGLQ